MGQVLGPRRTRDKLRVNKDMRVRRKGRGQRMRERVQADRIMGDDQVLSRRAGNCAGGGSGKLHSGEFAAQISPMRAWVKIASTLRHRVIVRPQKSPTIRPPCRRSGVIWSSRPAMITRHTWRAANGDPIVRCPKGDDEDSRDAGQGSRAVRAGSPTPTGVASGRTHAACGFHRGGGRGDRAVIAFSQISGSKPYKNSAHQCRRPKQGGHGQRQHGDGGRFCPMCV